MLLFKTEFCSRRIQVLQIKWIFKKHFPSISHFNFKVQRKTSNGLKKFHLAQINYQNVIHIYNRYQYIGLWLKNYEKIEHQ